MYVIKTSDRVAIDNVIETQMVQHITQTHTRTHARAPEYTHTHAHIHRRTFSFRKNLPVGSFTFWVYVYSATRMTLRVVTSHPTTSSSRPCRVSKMVAYFLHFAFASISMLSISLART